VFSVKEYAEGQGKEHVTADKSADVNIKADKISMEQRPVSQGKLVSTQVCKR
jgi:hypothetical protein